MFKYRSAGSEWCHSSVAEQWQYVYTSATPSDQAAVRGQWHSSRFSSVLRQPAFVEISWEQIEWWEGNAKTFTVRLHMSPCC